MNLSIIRRILGYVLILEAALLLLPTLVGIVYGEEEFRAYLIVSAIFLVWSAGKGMQSITRGLNAVNGVKNEKRNF